MAKLDLPIGFAEQYPPLNPRRRSCKGANRILMQFYATPDIRKALKLLAVQEDATVSELTRRILARTLEREGFLITDID